MYPYFRLAKVVLCGLMGKPKQFGEVGTLNMLVWPSDIDFYPEMNNGRHLTLMDLGRIDLAVRTGLFKLIQRNGWGVLVAGASVRYSHPLRPLKRFALYTRPLGQDGRWFYFLQETVQGGKTCSSVIFRGGVRGKNGLVPARKVLKQMGQAEWEPELPSWVTSWIEADENRKMGETWENHP